MTEKHNNSKADTADDDTADLSELVTTVEAAIEEHRQSQTQLREIISELETSIQEHTKSEQKLRELLTHAEYLIDGFEPQGSNDYKTQQRSQGQSATDEPEAAGSQDGPTGESNTNDAPATGESERDTMLAALETLCEDLNRLPEASDIRQETDYRPQAYTQEFGSYMSACRESSIDLEYYVLSDIVAIAEERDTIPPMSEYQSVGRFPQSIINSLFGSWKEVKKELYRQQSVSGFSTTTDNYREELIYQLQELAETLGHLPAASEISEQTWVTHQDYSAEFGSVEAAFEASGFDAEERILSDINKVKAELGAIPSVSEHEKLGECSINIVTNHFGSWGAAKSEFVEQHGDSEDATQNAQAQEESPDSEISAHDDDDADILDTIVTDIGDAARQTETDSTETNSGDKIPADNQPKHSTQGDTGSDGISDQYDERIVEAVNANFDSADGSMASELEARRQNAAAALETALNATEALGRTELIDQFYDEELYTGRGSFWIEDMRPVLRELGIYRRGEGGYVFKDQNSE